MMRDPNKAAVNELRLWLESGGGIPDAMALGMSEAMSDFTSNPGPGMENAYDAGREIARSLLGLD